MTGTVTLDNLGSSAIFDLLNIQVRKIKDAYFAEKVVSPEMRVDLAPDMRVGFKKIHTSILGRDVYLIVETENFVPAGHDMTSLSRAQVKIELKTEDTILTGTAGQTLSITNGSADVTEFVAEVGNTEALNDTTGVCNYTNLDEFNDKAIFKLSLRPHNRSVFNTWAENIYSSTNGLLPTLAIKVKPYNPSIEYDIVYGKGSSSRRSPGMPEWFGLFKAPGGSLFSLENKNVYEVYHGENAYNPLGNHAVDGAQVQRRLGKIESYSTNVQNRRVDLTNDIIYFYHDKNDNQIEINTLAKNNVGLVQFPANGDGFGRYGTDDAGGNDRRVGEIVGPGDHYLMPLTAAALFGVTQEVHAKGWRVDFGDMSSSNGSDPWQAGMIHHAGHGHLQRRSGLDADLHYLDTNGNSFHGTLNDARFDDAKNLTLYQIAYDYGFHDNYATTRNTYAGVNPAVGNHVNHGHWGLGAITAEVII